MNRVLIVDGDGASREALACLLDREGFAVTTAGTARAALAAFAPAGAELVLLESVLPDLPGTELCRLLRARAPRAAIIVVSARDGEADKVAGLDSGADDYVVKPFAARELTARIWAVMRRRREWREAVPREPGVLTAGPVRLDVERHVVTVAGRRVELPLREFELLTLLLRNAGRVLTRAQLTGLLWGPGHAAGGRSRTLDVHVKRLRERIEPDPAAPRHLLTVRGVGYKFEP